jgi:hypothetical protein
MENIFNITLMTDQIIVIGQYAININKAIYGFNNVLNYLGLILFSNKFNF